MTSTPEWIQPPLSPRDREEQAGHRGAVVWFTGLSGSGKTTVARVVDRRLWRAGRRSYLLDGDALRDGLCADLGFSPADRGENLRRFTELAKLFADSGVIALVSAIAPYESLRLRASERIGPERFMLIHVATPLEVCETRDPKGLYRRARAGQIPDFTGISSPYEEPSDPHLRLVPEQGDPSVQADLVLALLRDRGVAP